MFKQAPIGFLVLLWCNINSNPASAVEANPTIGVGVLDTPAITVARPAQVLIETIARAGDRLVAGGVHGVVIVSDDDGKNWRQVPFPVNATITQIGFADGKTGWAVGHFGIVAHTVDAGEHWKMQLNGYQAAQLSLEGAKAAMQPGDTDPPPARPQPQDTAPGATDASPQAPPSPALRHLHMAQRLVSEGPDKPFLLLDPRSPQNVAVLGAYSLADESDDGGASWHDWSTRIQNPGGLHIYGIVHRGNTELVAGEQGFLAAGDPATGLHILKSPYDGTFFGVVDGGADGIYAFGLLGHVYRTADMGTTWEPVTAPHSTTITCAVTQPDGHVLMADQDGRIWQVQPATGGKASILTPTTMRAPWPIIAMALARNNQLVVGGPGGIMTLAAKS